MNFWTYCNCSSINNSRPCTAAAPWDRGNIVRNRHSRPRVRRPQVFSHSLLLSLHSWFSLTSHSSSFSPRLLGALRRLRPAKAFLRTLRR